MQLKIQFESTADTIIDLDGISHHCRGNIADIQHDLRFGFHVMSIRANSNFVIKNFWIDDAPLDEMLYMGWLQNAESIHQPSTSAQAGETWILPFLYPFSSFISQIKNQIGNGRFGQDLHKDFMFFLPESVTLSQRFPTVVRDFFSYDSSFTLIPKKSIGWFRSDNLLPFESTDIPYPRQTLYQELLNNLHHLEFLDNHENQIRMKQQWNLDQPWRYQYFIRLESGKSPEEMSHWSKRFTWSRDRWPILIKWLKSLEFDNVLEGYVAELPPGAWAYPHCDGTLDRPLENDGVSRLHVPLKINDKVYFKFANFGLVDLSCASWLNNRRYVHAVVNDGDENRYIINVSLFSQTEPVRRLPDE